MAFTVSVVIPNFNGAHLLMRNLPSVIAHTSNHHAEIIVVDDGSKDDSLQVLSEQFPQVKAVRHQQNQGFSAAVLSGAQAATGELIFLLNSDVELVEDCLEKLLPYFDDGQTFSVCPMILEEDGSANRHAWNLRQFRYGSFKPVDWDLSQAQRSSTKLYTLYGSGGSLLVNRQLFLSLGGFHPIYRPFYAEDFDLGLRSWRMGYHNYFEPNTKLIHQSRGSIKDNVKRDYVKQTRRRNHYFLEWIHFPMWRLCLQVLPLTLWKLLGELLLLDYVNLKGFGNAVVRLDQVCQARKQLNHSAKTSFTEILKKLG